MEVSMARFLHALSASFLALAFAASAALGQSSEAGSPGFSQRAAAGLAKLRTRAENSTIIRFKPGTFEEMDKNFRSLKLENLPLPTINSLPSLNAIVIDRPPSDVSTMARDNRLLDNIESITPDAVVYGFASGCDDEEDLSDIPVEHTPENVLRVHGLQGTGSLSANVSSARQLWLIDSGIATDAAIADDLNVVARLQCLTDPCGIDGDTDKVGHGTMLAGIIGARAKDATFTNAGGLVGVAPNIRIVSVKIFDEDVPAGFVSVALRALKFVKDNAAHGDIVNISWGLFYDLRNASIPTLIEQAIYDAIDAKDLLVVVAAGNTDIIGSGYVQTISPARIGGIRGSGAVITVSAVRSKWNAAQNAWSRDRFWRFSAFGNNGTPAFAAPGVKIESYWPGGKVNRCSGTSFAAAHVAGLLEYGMPVRLGDADFDPSAIKLDKIYPSSDPADYEPSLLDPVAGKH
jgi:subtilisin family serine protease